MKRIHMKSFLIIYLSRKVVCGEIQGIEPLNDLVASFPFPFLQQLHYGSCFQCVCESEKSASAAKSLRYQSFLLKYV